MTQPTGTLYVVATPIGNLEDISPRAQRILREVDVIAAEDTRHTRKLLTHCQIQNQLIAYHDHNESRQSEVLIKKLLSGQSLALVSDAGTPCISDPGYRLVRRCSELAIRVVPVPGPSAVIAALSAAGLPTNQFYFAGFPPLKAGKRRKFFLELATIPVTMVFYESPYRVQKTLEVMQELMGDRECVVARELTKIHEEFVRGSIAEVRQAIGAKAVKGEFVILLSGCSEPDAKK